MNNKLLVAPSILAADFANLGRDVEMIQKAGADYVHCDVMDGVFVPNISFGIGTVEAVKRVAKIPLDVHLMITKPEKYIERFIKAGADIVTFHPIASDDPEKCMQIIHEAGKIGGMAINPDIPVSTIEKYLPCVDVVLVMSVYAGFGGQKFIPEVLEKVREVKSLAKKIGKEITVEIDGGISEKNSAICAEAGVDIAVAGSAVFKSEDPEATISAIKG